MEYHILREYHKLRVSQELRFRIFGVCLSIFPCASVNLHDRERFCYSRFFGQTLQLSKLLCKINLVSSYVH
jgi:hypothetical protein